MSGKVPTIAFFGATGGCGNSALVFALRAGHYVVALARNPSKLTSQLEAQGITTAVQSAQLTIVTGDALDKAAVKRTITANRPSYVVPFILTAIGGAPSLTWHWSKPLQVFTIDNPTVCADTARTLLAALQEVYTENPTLQTQRPKLTFVSTTGISSGPEDVPFGLRFLYHNLLAEPHLDKREMERLYHVNNNEIGGNGPVFSGIVGIRPTLLTGGISADSGVGLEKVRAGKEAKPATGFTVSRADVGHWIFENTLNEQNRASWENEMVSLAS